MSPSIAPAPAQGDAVGVQGLSKRFGGKLAVDDVTFRVPRGATFGLVGPNGAGKTTLFSILAGFVRPTSGRATVLDLDPDSIDALRAKRGVLPQDAVLPPGDRVGDFLIHMARLQGLPGETALAREALEEVEGGAWWNTRSGTLSHGMAKRVALAQAFLGNPELVLLDEPTAGLDPKAAWGVRRIIKAKRGARSIVISSHNLQEVEEICDHAAILDRGKLVTSGAMADLTAANEEIRIDVARGTRPGTASGEVSLEALRVLPSVRSVSFHVEPSQVAILFDRTAVDAETVIGAALLALLGNRVRISGVAKGRGLEQRVVDLT